MVELKKEFWEKFYSQDDGHVMYPHEEIIRFFSTYIRKRVDLAKFVDKCHFEPIPRVLDIGCGRGRHVVFSSELGLDIHAIDLSEEAIKLTKKWLETKNIQVDDSKVVTSSVTDMPWANDYFDFAISHGVFDSMYFDIAKQGMAEASRVIKKGGLFYIDLVSGDDSMHSKEYSDDEVVTTAHEYGTVQSYYNYSKINTLISHYFEIKEIFLIKKINVHSGDFISRWHLVLKNL
ncbi:type 11 methyltransferase [Thiomicrospira aerophila AL3]|uniref:Type 11 methyltransferase n=1 Tax=Thiomicrospira aerophila AL3 TaxID=717772 RepID=W0DT19_9GAMM|nr:class I SAM-dependent methyltransferase [Thiomicrospira aerophila]AHF01592.1 type 11 methyltransferase [Thiomicrospira aerophila AL3]